MTESEVISMKDNLKLLAKCVGYVFFVHFVSVGTMVLYNEDLINLRTALLSYLVYFTLLSPIYFGFSSF